MAFLAKGLNLRLQSLGTDAQGVCLSCCVDIGKDHIFRKALVLV